MPPRLATRRFLPRVATLRGIQHPSVLQSRCFTVLGIETSCDDTCVAVLDIPSTGDPTILHNESVTSGNRTFGGIHPLIAIESHRMNLGPLLRDCVSRFPPPDLVAVTRGPGMLAALAVGLDTAKGLAAAWGVPLIGVHHMQAHLLTPRLLDNGIPKFPFWTLLVSGGHTMLVKSSGITEHAVMSTTADIAIGDMIDKCARIIIPDDVISQHSSDSICYGRLLEEFSFPADSDISYGTPPTETFALRAPFTAHPGRDNSSIMSFSGLGAAVERIVPTLITLSSRRALGQETMRTAFNHVASRVSRFNATPLVISGGVASNRFLRYILKSQGVEVIAPPSRFCTDNAAMIAWTGYEMWRDGWKSEDNILSIRTWSLDNRVFMDEEEGGKREGGILGVPGWIRRHGFPETKLMPEGTEMQEVEGKLKGIPGMQTQFVRA